MGVSIVTRAMFIIRKTEDVQRSVNSNSQSEFSIFISGQRNVILKAAMAVVVKEQCVQHAITNHL